ncbi:hypothetical protein ON010_g18093 [Phytophthora cinnamomi]|nr:hypothetical protein ON010_g18093 [Phytophthora cinnamomi]
MLKAEVLSKALKTAAIGTGLDPQRVSSHSLRSGGASTLIAGDVDQLRLNSTGGGNLASFSDARITLKKLEHL